jgi:AcrR family transcriptional regulator
MAVSVRTQSEAQRRKQILDAARTVFGDKGYESATISDIVKKAGVAQGTFYLYFESKKGVVVELAQQPMSDMADRLQGILDGTESFVEILKKFVQIEELDSHVEVSEMAIQMFQGHMDSGQATIMKPEIAFEMFRIIMSGAMRRAFATDPRPATVDEIKEATETVILRAFATGKS